MTPRILKSTVIWAGLLGITPAYGQRTIDGENRRGAVATGRSLSNSNEDQAKETAAQEFREKLKAIGDEQLQGFLDHDSEIAGGLDYCLTEVLRRGGPRWEKILSDHFGAEVALVADGGDPSLKNRELQFFTAFRRMQKRQDPLMILIPGEATITLSAAYSVTIEANLTNLDPQKLPITLFVTADDYQPRTDKFRLEVTDSKGRQLPELKYGADTASVGGPKKLEFGESISLHLALDRYVTLEEPGKYTLVVKYHPSIEIGNEPNTDGLICCKSIPMTLVVEPIKIRTTTAEQQKAAELILKLPGSGVVQLVGGPYDVSLDKFMPKDSPAGQLKQMKWRAVPELIAAVNGDKLNATQRAWALGLLFLITNRHDPMVEGVETMGVLGHFEYRSGDPSMAWIQSKYGYLAMRNEPIDEKAQRAFAKGWKTWLDKDVIEVVRTDTTK
jgi:hypothetical protein